MEYLGNLFWFIFLTMAILPMVQQRMVESARLRLMQQLERKRKSRVIALIHRQESLSLLGFPLFRYIDIEDSEQVLRAIRMTPDDMPLDLILHTPGGLVLASEQIACALCRHPAKVTVFVPHYAMSGGTLLALAADEIVMDPNAVLGPIDPQLGEYPAASILKVVEEKPVAEIEDRTLILADMAHKAQRQVQDLATRILSKHTDPDRAREIATILTDGRWTHDYPLWLEEVRKLGLPVSDDMPGEVYALMNLYPQPVQRRPTVQYIPLPYRRPNEGPPQGQGAL
jgi:ClpP class serine protease